MASTSEEGKRTKPSAGTTHGLAGYPASRDSGARAASAALPFRRRFVSTLADGGENQNTKSCDFFHALELLCINNSNNNDKSGEFILPLFDFVQMKQV